MGIAFQKIELHQASQTLAVLATALRDEKPGLKERLFKIKSFEEHVFEKDINSSEAAQHLREAAIYQEIKGDLQRVADLFKNNKFKEGNELLEEALTRPLPFSLHAIDEDHTVNRKQIRTEIYTTVKEAAGDAYSSDTNKDVFHNSNIDIQVKIKGIEKAIKTLEEGWSGQILKEIPEDLFASKVLDEATQKIQTLETEKQGLNQRIQQLEAKPEHSNWDSFFKWTGVTAVGLLSLGLIARIFEKSPTSRI